MGKFVKCNYNNIHQQFSVSFKKRDLFNGVSTITNNDGQTLHLNTQGKESEFSNDVFALIIAVQA